MPFIFLLIVHNLNFSYLSIFSYYTIFKNPSFLKNFIKIKKPFSLIAKGLVIVWLPRQKDFRNFCLSDETEKVYQKLEEIIDIY